MSAVILTFPKSGRLPRAAIEATIEWLIDLLDNEDAPAMDCEPEVDEDSDGTEAAALPKRRCASGAAPVLRLSGDGHSSDAPNSGPAVAHRAWSELRGADDSDTLAPISHPGMP